MFRIFYFIIYIYQYVVQITRFQSQVVAGTKYLFDLELGSEPVAYPCSLGDPDLYPELCFGSAYRIGLRREFFLLNNTSII